MTSGSTFNYTKHTEQAKALARFTESDLHGFKKEELNKLLMSAYGQQLLPKVADLRTKCGINGILNAAEQTLVREFISKLANKELVGCENVHQYINDKHPNYFTDKGLIYETIVNGKKEEKCMSSANPWLVPDGMYSNFPGLQIMVGFCLAFIKKDKEGKLVIHDEPKLYSMVPFGGLAPSSAAIFGQVIIDNISRYFDGQTANGSGRAFISDLMSAFSQMSKEQYLMMQRQLALGPLNPCFTWGVIKGKSVSITPYVSTRQDLDWVVCSIKDEYIASFANVIESPTCRLIETGLKHSLGSCFPILVKALPFRFNAPILKDIPEAKVFLDTCRAQRQADEKGLSAWSCGFASTGNPSKQQNRLQKKLSLIMGAMLALDQKETLIVDDDSPSDVEGVYKVIQKWTTESPALKSKMSRLKFALKATSSVFHKIDQENRIVSYEGRTNVRILTLTAVTFSSVKEKEWSRVEREVDQKVSSIFTRDAENRKQNNVHYTMMLPIMSKDLFRHTNIQTNKQEGFSVFNLGSIHNMYGIISTMDTLPLAKSDGTSMWNLTLDQKSPIDYKSYLRMVASHNLCRSGYMLYPKYFFNPNLNLIRKLDGKTWNFETGEIDDEGIDLTAQINNLGSLAEHDIGLAPTTIVLPNHSSNTSNGQPAQPNSVTAPKNESNGGNETQQTTVDKLVEGVANVVKIDF